MAQFLQKMWLSLNIMKRTTKISLFILLAVSMGIVAFFLTLNAIRPENSLEQDPSQPTDVAKTKERYERSHMTPAMVYDEIVQNTKQIDTFTHLIAQEETVDPYTNPGYTIYYYKKPAKNDIEHSIRISILKPPFETYRQEAQTALLNTLNISEDMACRLNITMSTSYDVDPDLAGKNLPLRFCK